MVTPLPDWNLSTCTVASHLCKYLTCTVTPQSFTLGLKKKKWKKKIKKSIYLQNDSFCVCSGIKKNREQQKKKTRKEGRYLQNDSFCDCLGMKKNNKQKKEIKGGTWFKTTRFVFVSVNVYCLVGQVVKASALKAEGLEFESRLRQDFSGSSHTSDLKIGTPVATLPGAWRYRISSGTGRPCVSIL